MNNQNKTARVIAHDLCVDFPVGNFNHSLRGTVSQKVGGILRKGANSQYSVSALSNVNFDFKSGDRIGLIGHNGAGKSTLLQTINRGYFPTSGELQIDGRVIPLLNLGNGADPEFNGHENIKLLGLHMGLTPDEIEENRQDIVDFCELGDFLNLPLRSYSAGMYLRLTFAIGTAVNPEILLIDELFGAGDQGFFQKAQDRMESMIDEASILFLASHSTELIERYCETVIVMHKGHVSFVGKPQDAFIHYGEILQTIL